MGIARKNADFDISKNITQLNNTRSKKDKSTGIEKTKEESVICSVRLSEAERDELKSFFASKGIALSRGLLLGAFYLEDQVQNGNIKLSRAGILQR